MRGVGSIATQKVSVRLVSSTHRNLQALVNEGGFRDDLYYRLNVVKLSLPPLRERGGDIVAVANVRNGSAKTGAPALAQREHIGQRLARMFLIAQRVDDMEPRRLCRKRRHVRVLVGSNHQRLDPAFKVAPDVLQRFATAGGKLFGELQCVPTELMHGDLERRAGAKRRFFEQHRHVAPPERVRGGRLVRKVALRFQLCGEVDQPDEIAA